MRIHPPLACLAALGFLAGVSPGGELDVLLDPISPEVEKWASVCRVVETPEGPEFHWEHYREKADAVDFWPASTIKVYTAIAALEALNEAGLPLDTTVIFESRRDERWRLDSSRTLREMISEIFRRSSNEDYTLLLRMVGVDRINTEFLVPQRGFPHSALMRGYVRHHPYVYLREEPQRITLRAQDGREAKFEHTWSGTSYSQKRGATIISATTGNCTSTRELTDCLRRLFFHDHLPEAERFRLTPEQIKLLCEGGDGWTGLRTQEAGPFAWKDAAETVFPKAAYYHKAGSISNYTLDAAYLNDSESGTRFFLTVAANSGEPDTVRAMSRAIAEWVKGK